MKLKLSSRMLYVAVIGGLVLYAAAFWFIAVAPKRAKATEIASEAAELELVVAAARRAATAPPDTEPIAVADIFRLAKAMPAVPDMPGVLLELARIAEETGIEFQSISPQSSAVQGDYQIVPISLVFDGNFYELSDLVFRLRTLVGVRQGRLDATGRLFSIQTINFAESSNGFPEITASLTLQAYVYGTESPASSIPAEEEPAPAAANNGEPQPAEPAPAEAE